MKDSDLKRYQTKLLEMRNRTRSEINRMIEVVLDDAQSAGEHDHQVSECVDKEVILENSEEKLRSAVAMALERIEQGSFGTCESCGKTIPRQRLDALPYARYCVACERVMEQT